jgi:ribosomal protein S18 acetylase RimI-like enzyme
MNLNFSTLENVEKSEIVKTFNSAFENYFVKIELTEKSLTEKFAAENILLEKSVGAFVENKLIGFVFIGIDDFNGRKTAYNGGTGVVPGFRGNDLTGKMYKFLLPKLAVENIKSHLLEVITENRSAIKAYEKIDFKIERKLACFKGKISMSRINSDIEIKSFQLSKEH